MSASYYPPRLVGDGACTCCGDRSAMTSGGCLICNRQTFCQCGALVECGCGATYTHRCPSTLRARLEAV